MKHALVAYGVVLTLLLAVARRFESAGWTGVSGLDVAAGLVDAVLVLAVAAAVLLAGRLALEAWGRSMVRWRREQALAEATALPVAEVVGVTSWRPGTRRSPAPGEAQTAPAPPVAPDRTALPAPGALSAQTAPAGFTYVGPSYARGATPAPPLPDRRGRRI
ncbi:hypothetical protein JKP75_11640 [Blastococcus sp. TML/M2B]|uniref:hypothetical protein n=1 Tax=unclassified Blastococcus TaxID=2619396 RepID=UPI00190C79C5|nr:MULTISPECIES: hypothetical protein [unclassified Blastococcus]MBN1093147.1 hypothetical protein [Blastococcus sp. TML/M2B]MBN1096733.1 hypothetical protein [Blastococcus sp. TML/C7B]